MSTLYWFLREAADPNAQFFCFALVKIECGRKDPPFSDQITIPSPSTCTDQTARPDPTVVEQDDKISRVLRQLLALEKVSHAVLAVESLCQALAVFHVA